MTEWTSKKIRVRVPATSANVGAGFDCLGFAVNLYTELELELTTEDVFEFEIEGEGSAEISANKNNIVTTSIQKFLSRLKDPESKKIIGMRMKMKNAVPVARGLGSSAAAIVSGIFAANECLDRPMSKDELLNLATEIEGHPDNVAPALFGNFTTNITKTINDQIFVDSFSFKPKLHLKFIVAVPKFKLSTKKARAVLPRKVPREDAIFNISRVSMLIASLTTGSEKFLADAFDDRLHQPYRLKLIPGMDKVFDAAKKAGAVGVCLSGAGPSLMAFTLYRLRNAGDISRAMYQAFLDNKIRSSTKVLNLDTTGAVVI